MGDYVLVGSTNDFLKEDRYFQGLVDKSLKILKLKDCDYEYIELKLDLGKKKKLIVGVPKLVEQLFAERKKELMKKVRNKILKISQKNTNDTDLLKTFGLEINAFYLNGEIIAKGIITKEIEEIESRMHSVGKLTHECVCEDCIKRGLENPQSMDKEFYKAVKMILESKKELERLRSLV